MTERFHGFFGQPELFPLNTEKTLKQAKQDMLAQINKGTICPCCDRYIKKYRRKLTSSMAIGLMEFYKEQRRIHFSDWTSLKQLSLKSSLFQKVCGYGSDFAKLRHWNLVVRNTDVEGDKKSSGNFMMTKHGVDFVLCKSLVPKSLTIYQNKVVDQSIDQTNIIEALRNKFSYSELMMPLVPEGPFFTDK